MKKFIKVFNEDDKSKLVEAGYQLISEDETAATFLNDSRLRFDEADVNVVFSDLLTFQN